MYFILSIYIYFEYIWAKYNSQLFVSKKYRMRFNVFLNTVVDGGFFSPLREQLTGTAIINMLKINI
jgi:hypothetical protein